MTGRAVARAGKAEEPEDTLEITRYPSPPPHLTHASRGVHTPLFSSFQPRDLRFTSSHPFSAVAWNCDGRKLASVGIDRAVRVWTPEKNFDSRSATQYVGAHDYDVDSVTWNPTHPELFCSSSLRDRKIVFWDARQSRSVQSHICQFAPIQLVYAPDGKSMCVLGNAQHLTVMHLEQREGDTKPTWKQLKVGTFRSGSACFNHVGDGIVLGSPGLNSICIADYPSLNLREQFSAHVGGCTAVAFDPRGRYLASGGHDSIINLFDTTDWIIANTITACDHPITSLSFSHDGEYLAISSQGSYIDICATETGLPVHRLPILGPAPAVAWHPSKYAFAYCGHQSREGASQLAFISLFGPGL